MFIFFEL